MGLNSGFKWLMYKEILDRLSGFCNKRYSGATSIVLTVVYNYYNSNIGKIVLYQVLSKDCKKQILASSCPSVLPSTWNNSAPTRRIFMTLILEYFQKICPENSSFVETGLEQRVLYMKTNKAVRSYLAPFFLERKNISDKNRRENQIIYFGSLTFFTKIILFVRRCGNIFQSVAGHR